MYLTLRGVSRKLSLPYTTTRKYVMELKKAGMLNVREGPNGLMIDEGDLEKLEKFVKLVREGHSPRLALSKLKEGERDLEEIMIEMLEVQKRILERLEDISSALKSKRKGLFSKLFGLNP